MSERYRYKQKNWKQIIFILRFQFLPSAAILQNQTDKERIYCMCELLLTYKRKKYMVMDFDHCSQRKIP